MDTGAIGQMKPTKGTRNPDRNKPKLDQFRHFRPKAPQNMKARDMASERGVTGFMNFGKPKKDNSRVRHN